MKKKILLITCLSLICVSLTSCKTISDILSGGYISNSSDGPIVASSRQPIVDISTPPADNIEATRASKNYMDYINNNAYPLSATPSDGNAKLLIIPVWFNNSNRFIKEANKDSVKQDIHDTYFANNVDTVTKLEKTTGWHSVKTYYETESFGALNIDGVVSDWYEIDKSYTYYGNDPADDYSSAPKTTSLVEEATNWYFSNNPEENKTDYDCDKDGYLDGVMLIYAAPDYVTLNNDRYDNFWAYCYWIQDYSAQNTANPGVNAFFWASYDFMYGKEVASSRSGNNYHAGDTSHCTLDAHTYIHEMGHMFGLEDYYDYSEHGYFPAGGFSMQDYNVGGHDPFSSFALGWGKAYIPSGNATIDLYPFATTGEMIILSPGWNAYNSPFDEYLILEYYTDQGLNDLDSTYGYMSQYRKQYPMGTKDYGIRVWHVDARLLYTSTGAFSKNKLTTNPNITTGRVALLTSNTFDDGTDYTRQYLSPLSQDPTKSYYDKTFADYSLLQLIRNVTTITTKTTNKFDSSSLFKNGDTFTMNNYKKQFANSGKLDSGLDLGFEFVVNACNHDKASITVKKL